ncbi:rhodanese-like domain-containing protein [Legionella sp. W05-934-2]|jgi:rhodanese-related sulfurtransferase|uniref:rhodanese-like domain-containing protein n=1 Tax=Legionella sp. W05-934-2 TaxID=1198649 RepID=UPI0034632AE0
MNEVNIPCIDVHELKQKRDENSNLCLIDVREQDEWDLMHIPGAKHLPKDTIAERIHEVTTDKNKPIYLHCRSGVRSLYAAQVLLSLGYQQVFSVNGGIQEWAMFGYEIEE